MIKSNNKIGKKEKNMYINYGKCYAKYIDLGVDSEI